MFQNTEHKGLRENNNSESRTGVTGPETSVIGCFKMGGNIETTRA